jgi:peptidyl-prolyl cis-trans isomerase SurA
LHKRIWKFKIFRMVKNQSPKGDNQVIFIRPAILMIAVLVFSAFSGLAQENEPVVVDEVIAQVNDGVLTLSRVNREIKDFTESLVQQGKKPEEAKAEAEKKKGELIAGIINEELLVQKGKEIGVESDVEAQINQRFLQIMKEQNIKTMEALYQAMNGQGVKPDEIRELWRKQFTKEAVLYREVDQKVYWATTVTELRKYWEEHKQDFTKPEMVTLSEIFLNFAGRDMEVTRQKAKDLVAQLRKGASFEQMALDNSDRPDVKTTKGKVGKFNTGELNEKLGPPIKKVAAGGVTDPIETEEGIEIIRVDEREAASTESFFDDDAVRRVVATKKIPAERKKYMSELRKDAYIEISESYRALVSPFLTKDDATAEAKPNN